VGLGHVYQGRYKSFPVQGDEHFCTVASLRRAQRAESQFGAASGRMALVERLAASSRHEGGAVAVGRLAHRPTIELGRMGEPAGDRARVGIAPQKRSAGPPIWWVPLAETDRQTARTRIGVSANWSPADSRTTPDIWPSVACAAGSSLPILPISDLSRFPSPSSHRGVCRLALRARTVKNGRQCHSFVRHLFSLAIKFRSRGILQ
jgi:hypothetical protein